MSTIAFPTASFPAASSAARAVPARPAAPRLRITARGRLVLAVLIALPLVIVAMMVGFGSGGAVAGRDAAATSFEYVTVQPGQSLWGLAESIAPEADPADVVAELMNLNQLPSADLEPGDRLAVPMQYAD
jgi:hypothetical protein